MRSNTMRVRRRGRVTIPKQIREAAGLLPHSDVHFVYDREAVYLVPALLEDEELPGPKAWERMADGRPMPNVVRAIRLSRVGR